VVLMLGLDGRVEGEGHDRVEIALPGLQQQLAAAVIATGTPVVIALVHGGATPLGDIRHNATAILDCFYGGERAAEALASVLFGEYNPSGRLAVTVYDASFVDAVPLTDMNITTGIGRTYMYYQGEPEFSFGDGLSYTVWSLSWSSGAAPAPLLLTTAGSSSSGGSNGSSNVRSNVSSSVGAYSATFTVTLRNAGRSGGTCTLLAFWRPLGGLHAPLRQRLFGYGGLSLRPGEEGRLSFELRAEERLAVADEAGQRVLRAGSYEVFFKGAGDALSASLRMEGADRVVQPSLV
jgi:hypothetical protein